ncbi:hypothetical protein KFU94_16795 [Chloroflexi bacterium TSY]|nr:hypothetical protein [Chloroflexi bacterium TSY]
MTLQSITIKLPELVYQRLALRAQQSHSSIAEEIAAVIAEAVPADEKLSPDLEQDLEQLDFLSIDELWNAANLTAAAEDSEEMQLLLEKQQSESLTEQEKERAISLATRFNCIMVIRAKAAHRLKELGQDISSLSAESSNGQI